ncbi:DeoR/GlpR family transcriptional regulator of sugar metabolism [Neorhizobium galegae]|uniref:DeoR/GlpR family DNA-binding transcription regulator n=1 Tax=Neorhizobium galegae TaxID=399 RepID=UPI001AE57BAF|nr:DeoR/GlpR family DNA-binding transcription regulator [Neorhizobium galegae]MBP2547631.1 DeoR/GlpR family transcriptional regulator of sugar metabolism [Neorhizobium galegae]
MLTSQRKAVILDLLRRDGQVIARDLAQSLSLSEDTIRRDLREMAAEGLLTRVHGGALPLAPGLPDLTARRGLASDVKDRLGRAAVTLVRPGMTIFVDGGSTHAALLRHLPRDMAVTILTHSPTIAADLEHHAASVVLIGGTLYRHSMVAVGAQAAAQIAFLSPDIFFLGVTAIHATRGLSTGDFEEAAIKRQIAGRAGETITLVTLEKLDATSPHVIMPTAQLSTLVVPAETREDRLLPYRQAGIKIIAAD